MRGTELVAIDAARDATAIGECGLDGGPGAHALQEQIFRAHIRAAREAHKPLVIHVLRAHGAARRILREEGPVAGGLHSYSGGAGLVAAYRDLGLAFSFAGPVTYANARGPVAAARALRPLTARRRRWSSVKHEASLDACVHTDYNH